MDMDTNTEDIKYIKTHGGTALLWQTYKFHRHNGYKNGSVLWRCTSFKRTKCPGTITLMVSIIYIWHLFENSHSLTYFTRINSYYFLEWYISKTKDHTCGRDALTNDRLLVSNALLNNLITSDQPIPTLYEDNVFTLKQKGHDLLNAIPKFKNIKQSLYNARNKQLGSSRYNF